MYTRTDDQRSQTSRTTEIISSLIFRHSTMGHFLYTYIYIYCLAPKKADIYILVGGRSRIFDDRNIPSMQLNFFSFFILRLILQRVEYSVFFNQERSGITRKFFIRSSYSAFALVILSLFTRRRGVFHQKNELSFSPSYILYVQDKFQVRKYLMNQ